LDAGFSKENGQHFSDAFLCDLGPRGGAGRVRQPVWRQPFGAWPTSCGSLRHPAQAGRKWNVSSQPTHGLAAILPETGGRGCQDKPAVNELAMSITDNLTVAGAWIGKGELNFPEANGEELNALAPKRIESGFRYSLSYSVSDLKILEDHGS
jgi:hypothetical protein